MRKLSGAAALFLAVCLICFSVGTGISETGPVAASRTCRDIIEEAVTFYGSYGSEADPQIDGLLRELESLDPAAAARWTRIMDLWRSVQTELVITQDVLPDGLPETDELCLVVLGFQLNPDGSMREELVERLRVALASAEKYPDAWIVCTGGGTAADDPAATEAGRMADWLIDNGIAPERVIVENQSLTTAQNAILTLDILEERYPQVSQLAIISSDYHIATGTLLFGAEAILRAGEEGQEHFRVAANAAWHAPSGTLSTMFQAGALIELSGDVETAFEIYYETYDIHELPALKTVPEAQALDRIREAGVLRVGTAGDYKPMSFLDPETGTYWGFDTELAEDLASALGVGIEYVPTSWPTLMEDTLAGKFDLAICGITITDARKEQALMSDGYLQNGKTVLCRAEDADQYTSLEAVNRPEVRVMENPGGLNEKFARENLPDAVLIIHDVNQEIPGLIASGEADVMITEVMEAGYYVGQDSRLAAPLIYEPFTNGQLGVLLPKGSEDLLEYVNGFLAEEKETGRLDELAGQYIYRCITTAEAEAPQESDSTLIGSDNHWALLAVLCAATALAIWLEQKYKWASKISGAIITLIIAVVLVNTRVIPAASHLYDDIIWGYAVPLAIPLLLLQTNIRKIWKETGRFLLIFLIGAAGTVAGTVLATLLLGGAVKGLPGAAAMMTGSYIGGGVNFTAIADAFHVDSSLISATTVADNLNMALYFLVLLGIAGSAFFRKNYSHPHIDEVASKGKGDTETLARQYWTRKNVSLKDIAVDLAYAAVIVFLSRLIGSFFAGLIPKDNWFGQMLNTFFGSQYVWITNFSVIFATFFHRQAEEMHGAQELGTWLIYLFFFVIGVPASIGVLIRNAPILLLFCMIIVLINMAFCFVGGKLLKFDLEDIILASNANIGGPTTAAGMAISQGWAKLIGPCMLVGTFGYVIGTWLGILVGSLLGA